MGPSYTFYLPRKGEIVCIEHDQITVENALVKEVKHSYSSSSIVIDVYLKQ